MNKSKVLFTFQYSYLEEESEVLHIRHHLQRKLEHIINFKVCPNQFGHGSKLHPVQFVIQKYMIRSKIFQNGTPMKNLCKILRLGYEKEIQMQGFEHRQMNLNKSIYGHSIQLENNKCFAVPYDVWNLKRTRNLDEELLNATLNDGAHPNLEERVREVATVTARARGKEEACDCDGLVHAALEKGSISEIEEGGVGSAISDKSLVVEVKNG